MTHDDPLVPVQMLWNDWRTAEVRLSELEHIRWERPHGAPCALVHADIWCTSIARGSIRHVCSTPTAPHRVAVCILKRHTLHATFSELQRRADAAVRPGSPPPRTDYAIMPLRTA